MLDFKIFLKRQRLLKNLKTKIFKKYLEIKYFLENKLKMKAIKNIVNMHRKITIQHKKNNKINQKMRVLINTNPHMKVNLLHKRNKNIHKTLDSKKINKQLIILNTKNWLHKFWVKSQETNISEQ